MATTGKAPRFVILHVDVNETAIAGDGAKGYEAIQTLRIAASKYVSVTGGSFYKVIEKEHKGKQKHEIEEAALKAIEEGLVDASAAAQIRENASRFESGCLSAPLGGGRSVVLLRTFLSLLERIRTDESIERCVVVFRTNGPDLGDLLTGMRAVGAMKEGEWRGYGEWEYTCGELVVNNINKPSKEVSEQLLEMAKRNERVFDTSLHFNPSFDPSAAPLTSLFGHQQTGKFTPASFRDHVLSLLAATESPKVLFAGVREVFMVWQRFNRHHAKPFCCVPGNTGETAQTPIEIFLDDNAYEEEEKGKPGPYIVTVMSPDGSGGFAAGPLDMKYPQVVRPDKELAYTNESYYYDILFGTAVSEIRKAAKQQ
eukprot:NODE_1815_length_1395_cov_51.424220_g1642_i0.p1 GENE.NODE_1815_length_1395_cov_51.424220_g1642_i0~~NODE_1815_length_1395_cov_51.424220_g1642_i0.p1  ORF type:complete len:388 (+),score=89.34 NODE_1815_length_1395_cov_51.424220_g1642_i0:60-1166(+)